MLQSHLVTLQETTPYWKIMGLAPSIHQQPPLSTEFPSWIEVQEVIKHARSSSAPGPSSIPYKVYKKCPKLLRRLWKLMWLIWSKGTVPASWRRAEGCYVPKEQGVIKGFSRCLEHTGVLSQLIQEAKEKKGNLTFVWLDFANAYGSIPSNLVQVAMDHYDISHHIQGMITNYLGDIKLRFQSAMFTTKWQPVEKGIVTRCTISPILLVLGMNLIISAAIIKSRGLKTAVGSQQPAIRAWMTLP